MIVVKCSEKFYVVVAVAIYPHNNSKEKKTTTSTNMHLYPNQWSTTTTTSALFCLFRIFFIKKTSAVENRTFFHSKKTVSVESKNVLFNELVRCLQATLAYLNLI